MNRNTLSWVVIIIAAVSLASAYLSLRKIGGCQNLGSPEINEDSRAYRIAFRLADFWLSQGGMVLIIVLVSLALIGVIQLFG